MLRIYKEKNYLIYEIKNNNFNECGILNQTNIQNLCKKYQERRLAKWKNIIVTLLSIAMN